MDAVLKRFRTLKASKSLSTQCVVDRKDIETVLDYVLRVKLRLRKELGKDKKLLQFEDCFQRYIEHIKSVNEGKWIFEKHEDFFDIKEIRDLLPNLKKSLSADG